MMGQAEHSKITTCAYCGVGCAFKAEMKGNEVVRMVPWKDGKANHGHSCVKGRFAWGYATHKDRMLKPMIRKKLPIPGKKYLGKKRSTMRLANSVAFKISMVVIPSVVSPRHAAPTKKPIWYKN